MTPCEVILLLLQINASTYMSSFCIFIRQLIHLNNQEELSESKDDHRIRIFLYVESKAPAYDYSYEKMNIFCQIYIYMPYRQTSNIVDNISSIFTKHKFSRNAKLAIYVYSSNKCANLSYVLDISPDVLRKMCYACQGQFRQI